MKYLGKAVVVATTLSMLAIAAPAFARTNHTSTLTNTNTVGVSVSNDGTIINGTTANASTGDNGITGGGTIQTGAAYASAATENDVNGTAVSVQQPSCGTCSGNNNNAVSVGINNTGKVINGTTANASTGDNGVTGSSSRRGGSTSGTIVTGAASSYASTLNVVNSNVVRIKH